MPSVHEITHEIQVFLMVNNDIVLEETPGDDTHGTENGLKMLQVKLFD